MRIYCAFLKQVSFHKEFIKMIDVRNLFKKIGFDKVISVLSTGNIIFFSNETKDEIYFILKEVLSQYYLFDIDIFIKDVNEIQSALDNNPFEIKKDFYIQVFISNNGFENNLIHEFNKIELIEKEQAVIKNNTFYWYYEKNTKMNSNFLKILSRNNLKHNFTLRTIGSLQKVYNKIKLTV